ncbi:(2Fe-2S)-binding protein [Tuberibacillus sp. Marseille-P3662]|uniref:(2Fe-2S)-binding protein n=1 Tax=Tuberibacillus sp. Marseille-P3662 TaxID=1965358 RepID=UPI00111C5444|nr:(2Fe-2S)-binding protein [Tuberibacillus sp. Marseille-P3662]
MTEHELMVCRCEEVTFEEITETAYKHGCSARELKLRTRAGMGYCGGRTCRPLVDKITRDLEKKGQRNVTLKYQPPIRPISFGDLGGEPNE